jgi:hypothetical protein
MNMPWSQTWRSGLLRNLWVQLALLVIVAIVLVGLAAQYIW